MLDIEQTIFESDFVLADDNYISNGYILVSKEFLHNKILKGFKNSETNIMKKMPFEAGEWIELTQSGTECELFPDETIGIKIDENNYVDYKFVKTFIKSFPYSFIEFTCQKFNDGYLIKAFDDDETFVGCFATIAKGRRINAL